MVVDYERWGKNPKHAKAVRDLTQTNPDKLRGDEKIAFWINAYNLLTIDLIIKTGERKTIKNQGSLFRNVWKSHDWIIHQKKYTLHSIEHDILRSMGDPRIHMAINCASISCPDLRKEPYQAARLDEQLEEQTRRFIQNTHKGAKQTKHGLVVSKIFDWFEEDFGGQKEVLEFIQKRLPINNSPHKIAAYLDYDWGLNSR